MEEGSDDPGQIGPEEEKDNYSVDPPSVQNVTPAKSVMTDVSQQLTFKSISGFEKAIASLVEFLKTSGDLKACAERIHQVGTSDFQTILINEIKPILDTHTDKDTLRVIHDSFVEFSRRITNTVREW